MYLSTIYIYKYILIVYIYIVYEYIYIVYTNTYVCICIYVYTCIATHVAVYALSMIYSIGWGDSPCWFPPWSLPCPKDFAKELW